MYICVYDESLAVHQILIRHYKSTRLQFKRKKGRLMKGQKELPGWATIPVPGDMGRMDFLILRLVSVETDLTPGSISPSRKWG